jgi:hypothetical protein
MSSVPTLHVKKSKAVRFQVRRAQFGAVCAGELHLKEPVVANENDVVVCGRIEFVGGVRGNVGVSISVESGRDERTVSNASPCLRWDSQPFVRIHTERCPANILGLQLGAKR